MFPSPRIPRPAGLLLLAGPLMAQTPVGTAFVYQGRLLDPNGPANGSFALQFKLCDAATTPPGVPVGPTLILDGAGGNPTSDGATEVVCAASLKTPAARGRAARRAPVDRMAQDS